MKNSQLTIEKKILCEVWNVFLVFSESISPGTFLMIPPEIYSKKVKKKLD